MKADQQISSAEWQVMRIIWTLGSSTSAEITTLLQKKVDWKAATIKTLLGRLVDKGALSTEKEGRGYRYFPEISEQDAMFQSADDLFDSICERQVGPALHHVIQHATLSKENIEDLRHLLEEKIKTAPDQVDCCCVPGRKMDC
ncbi:MAG: CopY/TcrY family copper transport repressor [Limosilactobacillus sp.]|uniref:CopY/TcrY family copper transport repressor n=1 Tax=Limosilactobacillus sp. TaxID=2773925 RepID=UPI0027098C7B|nr:CopY/TcrY family copper transport repressor [Limosilactobacillus sp.]